MKRGIQLLPLFLMFVLSMLAQSNTFEKKIFVFGQDSLPYRILYPENYDNSKEYPLFIFLHGSGERGCDN